jgi:hypothetical protein
MQAGRKLRPGEPIGRCCDVCNPDAWLPDPQTIVIRRTRSSGRSETPPADLSAADAELLDSLKAWRLRAAREFRWIALASSRNRGFLRISAGILI